MKNKSEAIGRLFAAELQFRLVSAVKLAVHSEIQPLTVPVEWVHGKHRAKNSEIALRQDQADYAAWHLFNSATFLMAVAIKDAIVAVFPDPINDKDRNVRDAFQIARHIRNAFAHNPFCPIWSIDKKDRDKLFEVTDIISLNTKDLHGKAFDWPQYGGPLAILKLCWFVRFEILKDKAKRPYEREVSPPHKRYIQQGSLVLEAVRKIPRGAQRVSPEEVLRKFKIALVPAKKRENNRRKNLEG